MNKIIVCTWARNAEETLARAVDSIIAQSYHDWVYYLIDNASTDSTPDLMKNYAKQDKRVITICNTENNMQVFLDILPNILNQYSGSDYFIQLDADDSYKPDCFTKLLNFALENGLDAAACGSDIISTENHMIIEQRLIDGNLILEGSSFNTGFPYYYNFLRTFWGKLCSLGLLRRCEFIFPQNLIYGVDTFFGLELYKQADRIGIFPEALHEYYVSENSVSYSFDPTRVISDRLIYERGREYLVHKCGGVSKENERFLQEVYFQAVRATLKLISAPDSGNKLYALYKLFNNPKALRIFFIKLIGKIFKKLKCH